MITKRIGILFTLLLLMLQGFAQTKPDSVFRFSLKQSIQYTLAHQPTIVNAKYEEGKADAKVKEITGIGLPQINGSINLLDYVQIPTTLIPGAFVNQPGTFIPVKFGTQYNLTAQIDGSQILFDGTYIVGLQAAKIYRTVSTQGFDLANVNATSQVTKAYYLSLVSNWKLQMVKADANRLKTLMDNTQKLYETGFAERVDYQRIKVSYNNLVTLQTNMGRLLTMSYKLLKFQMGMPINDSIMLTDSLQTIPINPDVEADTSFKATNRIEVQMAQTNIFGAHELLKKDRFAYLPNLILFGSVNRVNQGASTDFFSGAQPWYPTALVGLKMNIPIFDGLQKNYRIQQDKYGVLEGELQFNTLKQSISLEISNSITNLENALADLKNQKENMELAQSVEHDTKIKYEAGTGSNIEVVDAETALIEAETNYYNALYNALIAKVDYETAKGTLLKNK